ncbi:unnamed protein product [Psylliodes chrysocephalus]|uniref:Uncharacterized protein n=1 Tax=Psylliodes chrysocephalus TaxID=3402493 RepID=A0A9P0GLB1_9CUCU|nr:unnamed protein product [Psylliodes chrysocephala]
MWFQIKTTPQLHYGAIHFWHAIKASRELPTNIKKIFERVVSTKAYFSHPVNLLLAMMFDPRDFVRELAIRRILKARQQTPKINFEAEYYINLTDWQKCTITESPLVMKLSDNCLQQLITGKETIIIDLFPCHTQTVEKCVKTVTVASLKVCGEISREGYIRTKLEAKKILPKFENKG